MFDLPLAKGELSPREKLREVMSAFKRGELRTWEKERPDGSVRPPSVVTDRKQAVAIALGEAGLRKSAADPNCADERVAGMMTHADRLLHQAGKRRLAGATDPHVAAMVPHMRRLLGTVLIEKPRSRLENNATVADGGTSLSAIVA